VNGKEKDPGAGGTGAREEIASSTRCNSSNPAADKSKRRSFADWCRSDRPRQLYFGSHGMDRLRQVVAAPEARDIDNWMDLEACIAAHSRDRDLKYVAFDAWRAFLDDPKGRP
jgi:hypothetical protein